MMELVKRFYCYVAFLIVFLIIRSDSVHAIRKPVLWDYSRLKEIRKDVSSIEEIEHIIEYADYCMSQPYVSVTDKSKSFCQDPHYYSSIGIYWWPDDSTPTGFPYVNRDGIANPEFNEYDYPRLKTLSKRLKYLSLAYFFTKNKKYYNYYLEQLEVWFVNEETRMYPNFEYAQVIPGINNNIGRGAGLSEAVEFNTILESYRLINTTHRIKRPIRKAIKKWFVDFSDWMATSTIGISCSEGKDNIAICYDVLLLNTSLFSGNTERAKEVILSFQDKRINKQIDEDGRFPMELKRTKAFYYSVYNLSHIVDFLLLAKSFGYDIYDQNKIIIDNAFSFLSQYIGHRERFQYSQINDWDNSEQMLIYQIERLTNYWEAPRVRSTNHKMNHSLQPIDRLQFILKYE